MHQVIVLAGPLTMTEPPRPLAGHPPTRHRDVDHALPTCQSAAAAVTNIGNLRAEGTNQTLGPCANMTRPGCSSDSGHARANMSVLLHAGSTAAKACAHGAAQAGSAPHAMRAHIPHRRVRLPYTVVRLVWARQVARRAVDRAAYARPRPSAAFGERLPGIFCTSFEVLRRVW